MSKEVSTKNTIITNQQSKLIEAYMQTANYKEAFDLSGMKLSQKQLNRIQEVKQECINNGMSESAIQQRVEKTVKEMKTQTAYFELAKNRVKAELARRVRLRRKEDMATSDEIMYYFTQVMRGEIKDQFGLDAPLSERTRAAIELAKRTVDLEIEKEQNTSPNINIQLNWQR